ncbi:hypothetical protein K437DRAFT_21096 [Tilletiaria anomala UBC 951]|uniref:Uncharacterized protein n=1 Tax=Tilletiaria anomala (strain ATCC 24038 / CBS 436.72 / UBC 951) TaxID=1037660 RepID=A0A066VB62_TILAU|nr:uncharacterized protein K437DRAFT_21096 [Tilletiaria anomala UBC 951]KDN38706.1 hypothetical protein K437DRAFT_21096 [Tilletiaria anomala UBC 951]
MEAKLLAYNFDHSSGDFQPVLLESGHNSRDVLGFLTRLRKHHNAIEIHQGSGVDHCSQDAIHHPLEGGRRVDLPHGYHSALLQAIADDERSLSPAFCSQPHLPKAIGDVQRRKEPRTMQHGVAIIDLYRRVRVFDCYATESTMVNTYIEPLRVRLGHEQQRTGPRRRTSWYDPSFLCIPIDELSNGFMLPWRSWTSRWRRFCLLMSSME